MFSFGGFSELECEKIKSSAVLYKDNKPISVAIITEDGALSNFFNVGVFTKEKERRKGYGTKVLKAANRRLKDQKLIYSYPDFYEKVLK